MSRSITLAALICSLLIMAGCGHHPEGHDDHASGHDAQGADHAAQGADHETHSYGLQLQLNDGQKWPVDDHTRLSAQKLAELMAGSEPLQSVDDARALADKLNEELKSLIQGCTMTGPAHDQLHLFLAALLPKVEELKTQTEIEPLQDIRTNIDSLIVAYEQHFES